MVTDDSRTLRLDKLESEVVVGECGARVPKSPVLIQWGRRPPTTASARMSTHPQLELTLKMHGALSPVLHVFMLWLHLCRPFSHSTQLPFPIRNQEGFTRMSTSFFCECEANGIIRCKVTVRQEAPFRDSGQILVGDILTAKGEREKREYTGCTNYSCICCTATHHQPAL